MRANFVGTSGAKRERLGTSPLCDYPLALAVFDRVEAERPATSAEPDARNEPDLAARPLLTGTRSEIAIHEFGRHRHHDQSKNPAHHTTGSKLALQRAVLKFNIDVVGRTVARVPVEENMPNYRSD